MNIQGIPEGHKKNIKDITIKTVACSMDKLIIIHLTRNQFQRFKSISTDIMELNPEVKSIYAEFDNKYYHIGGAQNILEDVHGFVFKITPHSPIRTHGQIDLYEKIKDLSPKGTTRNAIIIGTHSGLVPLHLAHLYNRLYCVEPDKTSFLESRDTLRTNKINNCMMFDAEVDKWLKDFEDGNYTPPGKRQRIGCAVINIDMTSDGSLQALLNIKPETIILFSENKDKIEKKADLFEKNEHKRTNTSKIEHLYLTKLKRQMNEQPERA